MSFFPGGGAGGGWPPPFFNQAPPGLPQMPFFTTDPSQNQSFPPGMPPDFQQGFNPYVQQLPVSVPGQPPAHPMPMPPAVSMSMPPQVTETPAPLDRSQEREHRRSEYQPPPGRYSPPPHDRRHSPDRGSRSRRDDGDKRSRQDSEERGRHRERVRHDRPRDSPTQSPKGKPKVDIDALLQDERLRNVLFAGISKATAKLEQSLQDTKGSKEQSDFDPSEAKNQLFPSASTAQKPRSILKRKDGTDGGSSKALSNLSALERTLHMLRGKGDVTSESAPSDKRPSPERKSPLSHGALSKLTAYGDGSKSDKYAKKKGSSESNSAQPFWSVPSKLETSKRDTDSFDAKERMFEEWRQSIGKQLDSSSKSHKKEMDKQPELVTEYRQGTKKREGHGGGEADKQEELDSTVQNILQSIGFNFDLSKRMQELARKKRMQEDEGSSGIRDASASFMDRGDLIAEELKASLLRSGSDLSSIDNLIKEARASSQGSRRSARAARSPSLDEQLSTRSREVRETSQGSSRYERSAREKEQFDRPRERASFSNIGVDQWEKISPESSPQRHGSPPSRKFRERDSLSPRHTYDDRGRRPVVSERFRDDENRNEYFYPEKDSYAEPSVPLLNPYSLRKKDEDLTGGLLKSMRVENFRVMSRPTHEDPEDDSYMETRRVILPAKTGHDKMRSPPRTVMRKRSPSPLAMPGSKDRRVSPSFYDDDYPRRRSPDDSYQRVRSDRLDSDGYPISERKRTPVRRRSPSPGRKSLSPRRRSPSPRRKERTRSPYRRHSRSRTRSRSPYKRKVSPRRRRSPSPRRRSRSPRRGRSRSPGRKRRSPGRRSPVSHNRRRTPPKKAQYPRSRSKERSRPGNSKPPLDSGNRNSHQAATDSKAKPYQIRKDISKLPEKERKEELKKALSATGAVEEPKAKAEEDPKKAARVSAAVADITSLANLSELQIRKMTAEVSILGFDEQQKVVTNLASRRAKVLSLKSDLERLKKSQNELMRKSQRSGLGNADPHLKANNLCQMETEKEIDRLSAPDLIVSLDSKLEQTLKDIQAKLDKNTANSKAKGKIPNKGNGSQSQGSVTPSQSGIKESIAQAMETSDKTNWTSVSVQDVDLPDITPTKADKKKTERKESDPVKPKRDIYYEYVDGKNHWCNHCHISLNALDQFFNHLHGKKHFTAISDVKKPWDESFRRNAMKKVGKAQSRRIKGTEMMFPIAGFYCTICNTYSGDFRAAEKHLKSDDHYDTYLEFLRDNPGYEKKLLLEKTKGRGQDVSGAKKDWKSTREPSPPGKKGKKSKSLRLKKEEEEKNSASNQDNTETVDMDLDEEERNDDVDVESKVPKMTGKMANSVASILSSLPEVLASSSSGSSVEMKTSKEDEVKPLDKFLTIASKEEEKEGEESAEDKLKPKKKAKSAKIPVIDVKKELDLLDIPMPEVPELTSIPLPLVEPVVVPSTVKTLKEVEDEEKRMMGIDVDADEEKPLGLTKRPPPLSKPEESADKEGEGKEVTSTKTLDTLFTKMSKASVTTAAPKAKFQHVKELSELEQKIEQGIQEKIEKEKQKMIKIQEKMELKEKKLEERMMRKAERKRRRVYSDSSSEEDSETEEQKDGGNIDIEIHLKLKPTDAEEESVLSKTESGNDETTTQNESISCDGVSIPHSLEGGDTLVPLAADEEKEEKEGLAELEPSGIESKVGDASAMDVDSVTVEKQKCTVELTDEESVKTGVSDNATLEVSGLGDIPVLQQTDLVTEKLDTSEDVVVVVAKGFSMPDDSVSITSSAMEIAEDVAAVTEDKNEGSCGTETTEEVSTLGMSCQMEVTQKESTDSGSGEEKNVAGDLQLLPESNDAPTMEVSEHASKSGGVEEKMEDQSSLTLLSSEDCTEQLSTDNGSKSSGKNKNKTKLAKMVLLEALQSENDLIGVLHSSPETILREEQKRRTGARRAVGRRGGRASRAQKRAAQPCPEEEEANISLDDFVVLSEVAEDDVGKAEEDRPVVELETSNSNDLMPSGETSVPETSNSNDLMPSGDTSVPETSNSNDLMPRGDTSVPETSNSNDLMPSGETSVPSMDDDGDKAGKMEEVGEIEAVKPLSGGKQSRGGKTGTRGRGRGRKLAIAKKGSESASQPEAPSTPGLSEENKGLVVDDLGRGEEGTVKEEDKNSVICTESISTPSCVEVQEEEEVPVPTPSPSRTRRGRSAAATKTTPVQSVRQTRTRGKKKDADSEPAVPAMKEVVKVDETESKISGEEDQDKSEDMPSLVSVLESDDKAGPSGDVENDQTELTTTRVTRSKQTKTVSVMVTDVAEENIQTPELEERENDGGKEEEMPALESERTDEDQSSEGRSLPSREAKTVASVFEDDQDKREEGSNDSDATITEDGENSDLISISQAALLSEKLVEQGEETAIELTSAMSLNPDLSSALPLASRDPPMSGVVGDLNSTDKMEMPAAVVAGGDEMPVVANPPELDNLPTAGLSLGLGEDNSMEFPDSMAGFTVLDVEGQPDGDNPAGQ